MTFDTAVLTGLKKGKVATVPAAIFPSVFNPFGTIVLPVKSAVCSNSWSKPIPCFFKKSTPPAPIINGTPNLPDFFAKLFIALLYAERFTFGNLAKSFNSFKLIPSFCTLGSLEIFFTKVLNLFWVTPDCLTSSIIGLSPIFAAPVDIIVPFLTS